MSNNLLLTKLRKLLKSDLDLQAPCQNVNYKQVSGKGQPGGIYHVNTQNVVKFYFATRKSWPEYLIKDQIKSWKSALKLLKLI